MTAEDFKKVEKNTSSIDGFSKEELYNIAFFESVTNYYNWNWMREKLTNYEQYGIDDFIFVHFDVKDFKMVNELYGHAVGDNLLRRICEAMKNCEWSYFSCRCDNDNFAMMVKRMSREEIKTKLEQFFDNLSVLPEDPSYPIYFRCGVADINNVKDYRVIITDMAKLAQNLGNNANVTEIMFYTDEMKEEQIKGKVIKQEISRALSNNEFLVYYQPKYSPVTNSIVGAEALIRWNYMHKEIWGPGKFVPYLEKERAIDIIDRFVLEQVCIKLEEWKHLGKKLVPISVNLSKTHLYNPTIIQKILSIVDKYDVERRFIEFELTESSTYEDKAYMIKVMNELRNLGFLLSIDDFGTGYSSLNLLSTMPLTTLKIDKSFIDSIEESDGSKAKFILKDIFGMTKHLDITSVAEGVETENQKELIKQWGCDYIQGYYYSKPLPVAEFEKLLI